MTDSSNEQLTGRSSGHTAAEEKNILGRSVVQLDVVEALKQVLQWTPLYKPGLNRALIQAAKVGSVGCVKVLLSTGAEVDAEDENGDTAFVHAFRSRHVPVMCALHSAGATTEIAKMSLALSPSPAGTGTDAEFVKLCYSLDIPVENEDWNCADPSEVYPLMEDLKLDPFQGQYGRHDFEDSPFMYLVQEGRPAVLESLVSKHPCINKYTKEELQGLIDRALFKAIHSRRLDNVKLLLASLGARLEARESLKCRTPLLVACGTDEAIACYLLQLGADHTAVDSDGLTALHWAACAGYRCVCDILLDKGLHVDVRANLGATPLMVACSTRCTDVVSLLLSPRSTNATADPNTNPATSNSTAADPNNISLANPNTIPANRSSTAADPNKSSSSSITADPNTCTPEGWVALHVAMRACAASAVRHLLAAGALPDIQSTTLTHNGDLVPGDTPLLIAVSLSSVRMVRMLMNAGCDTNKSGHVLTESTGGGVVCVRRTPVQHALMSRAWDIAEILIRAQCDVGTVRGYLTEGTTLVQGGGSGGEESSDSEKEDIVLLEDTSALVMEKLDRHSGGKSLDPSITKLPPLPLPPVRVSRERYNVLKALLGCAGPAKLKYLVRESVRGVLRGGYLAGRVKQLGLVEKLQQFLLYDDLFAAQAGAFEV